MEATLKLSRRATYADYLAAEQHSATRHEFVDGVIVAMAGGSDEHNALTSRLTALCSLRLTGECRHYSPDQRFWIAATGRGRYSDGSIICAKPAHPSHDRQATTNPTVVFEVLSPSSEGDDAGDKRRDFQSLDSLQAYVLVTQDQRLVTIFRRDSQGDWQDQPDVYQEGTFELPTLASPMLVGDIYDNILDEAGQSLLR